jgi:prepilin-type N-terminal cleavage/methylation domain-containing protein
VNWFARWHRNRRKQAGFTLLEVFLALFVFSIAALAVAAMTFMSIQGNAMTNQMSQATFLAQNVMEELLTAEDMTGVPLNVDHVETNLKSDGNTPGGAYTLNWVVTGNGPTVSTRWVRVEVSWVDVKGDHHIVIKSLWRPL